MFRRNSRILQKEFFFCSGALLPATELQNSVEKEEEGTVPRPSPVHLIYYIICAIYQHFYKRSVQLSQTNLLNLLQFYFQQRFITIYLNPSVKCLTKRYYIDDDNCFDSNSNENTTTSLVKCSTENDNDCWNAHLPKLSPNQSWFDSFEETEKIKNKRRVKKKKVVQQKRKVFFGKIELFDKKKEKNTESLKQQRIRFFVNLFKYFGETEKIDAHWEEGFVHVTYKSINFARNAVEGLSTSQKRNDIFQIANQSEVSKKIEKNQKIEFPLKLNFYVRWSMKNSLQKKQQKKKIIEENF